MALANKYKAHSLYWDLEAQSIVQKTDLLKRYQKYGKLNLPEHISYFASKFEFQVYQALVKLYGVNAVIHQYPLPIISEGKCYPIGKDWKIDFAVKPSIDSSFPIMLVEAKGRLTETFTRNLAFLEQTNPTAFERFYLLFHRAIPQGNKLIRNLMSTDVKDRILTLSQFLQKQVNSHEVRIKTTDYQILGD